MQEKQDQKVVFVFLSIHTNFKHEEHTQPRSTTKPIKKKKNQKQNLATQTMTTIHPSKTK